MFQHFLVPLDGSELSERAALVSLDLARKLGVRITGFVAEPVPPRQGSLPPMRQAGGTSRTNPCPKVLDPLEAGSRQG
jgi:nucleotide-binding universal stress UspA family protein